MLNLSRIPANVGYYKSFKVLSYDNHAPTGQPRTFEVRRYKKYVEFRVHTGWFSESRGTGHASHRKVKVTDEQVLARVDALIARPGEVTGLFPLLDTLKEREVVPDLQPLVEPVEAGRRRAS